MVAYVRRIDERVLTFGSDTAARAGDKQVVRDRETGTAGRLADGVAVRGRLEGKRLARAVAHPAFWFGWRGSFPHSDVWRPEASQIGQQK